MTPPELVAEFMRAFGQEVAASPRIPPAAVIDLRVALVREEATELVEAAHSMDRVAVAHEAADLVIVAYGGAFDFGLPTDGWPRTSDLAVGLLDLVDTFDRARTDGLPMSAGYYLRALVAEAYRAASYFGVAPDVLDLVIAEVHRANMSKAEADGTVRRRADGKVLKSDRYVAPAVAAVLERAGVPA